MRTQYTWDAENRLVRVGPPAGYENAGDVQVAFAYDYLSRRVAKRVQVYDPNASPAWVLTKDRRFIWDGWLMLREIDQDSVPVQTYLWGLDLAGQAGAGAGAGAGGPASGRSSTAFLTQAGGIGGLIAVNIAQPEPNTPSGTFIYCYDGNGNVTQLVKPSNGTLSAKYDYDPYGTRVNAPAAGEAVQPWRFSTKQLDSETGLQYYGYRYRDRERWISRDPLEEQGGPNLVEFIGNNPNSNIDPLGRDWLPIGGNWDAWVQGSKSIGLSDGLWDMNPAVWLFRFLARYGEIGISTYRLPNDVAVRAFTTMSTFPLLLSQIESNAHAEARNLKCQPGSVTTGYWSDTQRGTGVVEWHSARYVSGLTYILQSVTWKARWHCYLEARCWCCLSGSCGQQTRVRCKLDMSGWDLYDFHGNGSADWLQSKGGSFFLLFDAMFRLRPQVQTSGCTDGTPPSGRSWE